MNLSKYRVYAAFALAASCSTAIVAQGPSQPLPDDLDSAWNAGGTLLIPLSGHNMDDVAVVVQPDGRILLASDCAVGSVPTFCMARVQPNGLRDYSFGPAETGIFAFSQFPSYPVSRFVRALVRQNDGRIVMAGASASATPENDDTVYASAARLLEDGTLDPSVPEQPMRFEFSHYAELSQNIISAAAQQPDGKLVVAGYTYRAGADSSNIDFAAARLDTDMTLDPSFNGNGIRVAAFDLGDTDSDIPLAVALQPDGKIVLAGVAATASNGLDAAVLRLNADGSPDESFGNVGRVVIDFNGHHLDDQLAAVAVDGMGRIWLAGSYQWTGSDSDFLVARLRTDGELDTDFCGGKGYKTVAFDLDEMALGTMTDVALELLLQSDGKIVLAGDASNGEADGAGEDFAAARLLPDCSLDPTFGAGGRLSGRFAAAMPYNYVTDAALGGSGIVLAGVGGTDFDSHGSITNGQFGVAMIRLDLIFTDTFEH